MHACSFAFDQMLESGLWCDCLTFGIIFGTSVGFALSPLCELIVLGIRALIKRFKAKKKPHSQA